MTDTTCGGLKTCRLCFSLTRRCASAATINVVHIASVRARWQQRVTLAAFDSCWLTRGLFLNGWRFRAFTKTFATDPARMVLQKQIQAFSLPTSYATGTWAVQWLRYEYQRTYSHAVAISSNIKMYRRARPNVVVHYCLLINEANQPADAIVAAPGSYLFDSATAAC